MKNLSTLHGLTMAAALGGLVFSASAPAQQRSDSCGDVEQSGTFVAHSKNVGFLLGVRWGTGTVTLNDGTKFNFNFKGLKALETGVAVNDAEGEIYNLKTPEDMIGAFYGASQSVTLAKGKGEVVMNNSKCVVIKARGKGEGVQLSAPAPSGVYVQLAN